MANEILPQNGIKEIAKQIFGKMKIFDTASNTTAFTSSDVADGNASSWTTVTPVATGETHAGIFAKMSQMFKNIRYLYSLASHKVLFFENQSVSARTGDILTLNDSSITADHIVTECVWGNQSYITSDVTWTTSDGRLVLNGTCTTATTVTLTLVKKDN